MCSLINHEVSRFMNMPQWVQISGPWKYTCRSSCHWVVSAYFSMFQPWHILVGIMIPGLNLKNAWNHEQGQWYLQISPSDKPSAWGIPVPISILRFAHKQDTSSKLPFWGSPSLSGQNQFGINSMYCQFGYIIVKSSSKLQNSEEIPAKSSCRGRPRPAPGTSLTDSDES